jgi:histidine kinase
MKLRIILLGFCLFFHSSLTAQWESLGDSIVPIGQRVSSIKLAKDHSIWLISTPDRLNTTEQILQTYRSIDEGKTWTSSSIAIAPSLQRHGDISPIDSLNAFIALGDYGLYKTTNGGRSWTKVQSYLHPCLFVHFFNAKEGWVFNGPVRGNILKDSKPPILNSVTKDGGNTWVQVGGEDWNQPEGTSLPEKDKMEFVAITYTLNSSYDYSGDTIVIGMGQGTYWLSRDKGFNWTRKDTPLSKLDLVTSTLSLKNTNTIMVAGNYFNSTVTTSVDRPPGRSPISFTTVDGGSNWIEGNPGINAAALHYVPGSDSVFVIVGHRYSYKGAQGTAITYDYGVNWEIIDNHRLIALDFIDKEKGIATCCNIDNWATANGAIYKWNLLLPDSQKEQNAWQLWLINILICIGLYLIYKYWIRKNLYKREITQQIFKLEQSAIQAQINPHFIFNCLNTIQSLVNINDKKTANSYLVHFAHLTRGMLRASSEDEIPLEEDIELLKSYLELEKMRFNNLFDYSIWIDDNVNLYDVMVPAMLIQPIIENSIVKGLSNQPEEGKIKIAYYVKDDYLIIIIEDNVIGIYQTGQKQIFKKDPWLKSVGISNTQKRLDLLHTNNEMKVDEIKSLNGQVIGTKVELKILLN